MVRVGAMVWDGPFHALGRGEGLVGCVQSRELGAQTPRLPRFILPVSFSDTLLVVLIWDIFWWSFVVTFGVLKGLNHKATKFTARKQGAVSDQWPRQDQNFLFAVQTVNCKFPNIYQIEWALCVDADKVNSLDEKMKLQDNFYIFRNRQLQWYWYAIRFLSGKQLQKHDIAATLRYLVRKPMSKTKRRNNVSFFSEQQRRKPNVVTALWPKIRIKHLDKNARNK